jgi:hypothetical protein
MAIMTQHGKQTYFCPVQEVTTTQMAKVVVKYGNDHPEKLWMRASMLTLFALRGAYPCEKN